MIITRTPLRVSLLGGGTDLPAYFSKSQGTVLSFALNKYIYISVNHLAESKDIVLKYSKLERVDAVNKLRHPIVREAISTYGLSGIDISVTSEIPAGTGLGSSSSFTVGIIKALSTYSGESLSRIALAESACNLEIDILKEPIGKQDQYAAAYGGFSQYLFNPDGSVETRKPKNIDSIGVGIQENALLVRIGSTRSASRILSKIQSNYDSPMQLDKLSKLADLTLQFCNESNKSIASLAECIDASWEIKKSLTPGISNPEVDAFIDFARSSGAIGAKLLGAGSSGYVFLLFKSPIIRDLFVTRNTLNYVTLEPKIDSDGCSIIYNSEVQ